MIGGSRANRLAILALLLNVAWTAVPAQESSQLTLRQAIDTALDRNPQGAVARADVQAADAQARAVRTDLLPQFQLQEDISRGNDPVYAFGTRLRQQRFMQNDFALDALNKPAPIGNFATQLTGQWTVFDWLGTERRIRSAKLAAGSMAAMNDAANQTIVLSVIDAYQSALYAERRIELAQHQETTAESFLKDAKARVKAGLAVDADLLSAQVNLAERKQELISSEGEVDDAWAVLQAAMGTTMPQRPWLKPIAARTYPALILADAVASALKARPDLKALRRRTEAQNVTVNAAKSAFGPRISVYGTWEMDRETFAGSGGNNWVAGVQLSLDILPLAKRARLAEQEAVRSRAEAAEQLREGQIRMAVNQAWTAHRTAEQVVETARASTRQSAEGLRILENRYQAGLSTMTDLLRAQDAERSSQDNYWHAVYRNAATYADLLYATGTLTPASAETLQ